MKGAFTTTGIILKKRDFGDQDRFITVLTKDRGKITCLAKGIRKISSRRNPPIELLNRVNLSFWKSNYYYYLTQTVLEERFAELKSTMDRLTSALFLAELVERLTPEETPLPELYQRLNEALSLMDFYPDQHERIRVASVLQILDRLGVLPDFRKCGSCHRLLPKENAFLDEKHFNLECKACAEKNFGQDQTQNKPDKEWVVDDERIACAPQTRSASGVSYPAFSDEGARMSGLNAVGYAHYCSGDFVSGPKHEIPLDTLKILHFLRQRPLLAVLKLKLDDSHVLALNTLGRLFLSQNLYEPLRCEAFLGEY